MLDIQKIREDFPILHQKVHGRPLVYFDNGATTQKPKVVIDCLKEVYSSRNSNVHRGVHFLSGQMTERYELARTKAQKYINASNWNEIIFTAGTTASINLLAFSFGETYVQKGDELQISALEHNSNIVPRQQ